MGISRNSGAPKDAYNAVKTYFFLMGIVRLMPWSFFAMANQYFMYKFRNTALDDWDGEDGRTDLQAQFASIHTICVQVTNVTFLLLSFFFGHRLSRRSRIIGALSVILALFAASACLVMVDSDSWQTDFFVLTLATVVIINAMNSVYGYAMYCTAPCFPPAYFRLYLAGQNTADVFTSTLQVLSLATGLSVIDSALVYFTLGLAVVLCSLLLTLLMCTRNQFFIHQMSREVEEKELKKKRGFVEFEEAKSVLKKIWPVFLNWVLYVLTSTTVHAGVTSLIVSENHGSGLWSDVYFLPTVNFLAGSILNLAGVGLVASDAIGFNTLWFTVLSTTRLLVLVPLMMLCNEHPRHHLPVIFPHDNQYIFIAVVFFFSNGFCSYKVETWVQTLVEPDELKVALEVLILGLGIIQSTLSFLSFAFVEIL